RVVLMMFLLPCSLLRSAHESSFPLVLFCCHELTAGSVDVFPPGVSKCRRYARVVESSNKFVSHIRVAGGPNRSWSGVEGDGVDVDPASPSCVEFFCEEVGSPRVIIHVFDEGVFDGHAPAGYFEVVSRSIEHFINFPAAVDWDEVVSKLIV